MFKKCCVCERNTTCEENLIRLRKLIIAGLAGSIGAGALGFFALPLIGFGLAGVQAGSIAAAWQSTIGNVAAGSLFAALQSLGATGLGSILFGSAGAAIPLLLTIAVTHLNWCDDEDHRKTCEEQEEAEKIKTMQQTKK